MLGPGDAAMVGLGRVSVFWALSRWAHNKSQ
jgi:hypothetical protein